MNLLAVNVAMPRTVSHQGKLIATGIFKESADRRLRLGKLSLEGDGQADLAVHGGEHKAAYAYPFEHYALWERELSRNDFRFGQFGENLTVTGLSEETVCVGDIFRVGEALVEVTQPRVPCFKLALRMGLPEFPKQFLQSRRSGFYLRVLEEGVIGAGDDIVRVGTGPEQMSIRSLLNLVYFEHDNVEGAAQALRIPALSPGWRETIEARLKATQEPP